MFKAHVFHVFIASPSDVASERQLTLERIQVWNDNHSESRGVVLMPLSYERNTPSRIGSNPQDVIDKYVLDKADFLIAIFWSRIGSGATVKEIKRHVDSGKPGALLFSLKDVPFDSTDEVEKIKELKKSYQNTSFYHQFRTDPEFNNYIDRELIKFVNDLPDEDIAQLNNVAQEHVEISSKAKSILLILGKTDKPLRVQDFHHRFQIDSGLEQIYNGSNLREWVDWKDSIEQLNTAGFIAYYMLLSYGDSYQLTKSGWEMADKLAADT